MMKILVIMMYLVGFCTLANAVDEEKKSHEYDHDTDEHKNKDKSKGHDEDKEDDHGVAGEHDDHGEHEEGEENPQVGSTKGILEANETSGFKLSPEAEKNFGIQKIKVGNATLVEIPKEAILTAVSEVNIYRVREGFYKRIDFIKMKDANNLISVKSKDLKSGDEIVIRGLGFLRIAELAAFGGAPEGHSH